MKITTPNAFKYAALLIASIFAVNTYSQNNNPDEQSEAEQIFSEYFNDWYQVEIIIFERIEQSSNDPELWPVDLTLSYTPPYAFLKDPKALEVTNNTLEASNNGEAATEELPGESNSALLQTLKRSDVDDPLNKKYRSAVAKAELDRLTPKEKPMMLLDDEVKTLLEEARIIGRNPYMRLLNHSAWRQPMKAQDEAPWLIMSGGDMFGEHSELEGSIKLHLSRYLHIHSNLWLSQFEANIGQETEHWPPLPLRPRPPIEIDVDESEEELALDTDQNAEDATETSANTELTTSNNTNEQDAMLPSIERESLSNYLDGSDRDLGFGYKSNSGTGFGDNSTSLIGEFDTSNASPYVTTSIVELKQKRRMRSDELHYIDHPKLGILITLSKYEPEFIAPE